MTETQIEAPDHGSDAQRIQEKWLPVWDELAPFRAGRPGRRAARASTCSTCSRTPRATCTWVTPRRTRSATSSRATGCSAATTSCTRSAGTPSVCPPRTPPSSAAPTRASGRTTNIAAAEGVDAPLRLLVRLGPACCTPATRSTTAGTSGCSCGCSSAAWPTARPAAVNWCPNDQTVLANEQVVDGRCERCDTPVTKKKLTQWYFRITDYADRLLDDMDQLEGRWPDKVLTMQRNWIGRSTGADVDFAIEGRDEPVTVYTTRPDTLYGATFFVVAADSDLAAELAAGTPGRRRSSTAYLEQVAPRPARSSGCRPSGEKTGRLPASGTRSTRSTASGCRSGRRTTCWPTTAHGAIMAVPAHDQRDLDFARAFDLPVRVVVDTRRARTRPTTGRRRPTGDGVLVNSGAAGRAAQGPRPSTRDRRRSCDERRGRARRAIELPAARLADLAAAVLGHADPDHPLPVVRRGRRCRTTSCR